MRRATPEPTPGMRAISHAVATFGLRRHSTVIDGVAVGLLGSSAPIVSVTTAEQRAIGERTTWRVADSGRMGDGVGLPHVVKDLSSIAMCKVIRAPAIGRKGLSIQEIERVGRRLSSPARGGRMVESHPNRRAFGVSKRS